MNHYSYSDMKTGMKESFDVCITEDMVNAFFNITKDVNPLHNDKEFAIQKGYLDRVVYGMLTASFCSTLAGVYLPGELSLIHSVEVKFIKPVMIGERLKIVGEVESMNDTVQQIVLKVMMYNQDNIKVLRGKMKVGFLHE